MIKKTPSSSLNQFKFTYAGQNNLTVPDIKNIYSKNKDNEQIQTAITGSTSFGAMNTSFLNSSTAPVKSDNTLTKIAKVRDIVSSNNSLDSALEPLSKKHPFEISIRKKYVLLIKSYLSNHSMLT